MQMSSLEEKHMEVEHHLGGDSQEGVSTKNMPDLCKDDKTIETSIVKCEPQQVGLFKLKANIDIHISRHICKEIIL